MRPFGDLLGSARAELPAPPLARWASYFFTASVLTYLISIAASQTLLAATTMCYVAHLFRDRPTVKFPPAKAPLLLFCFLTLLSVFWATDPAVGWTAVRKLVLFLIMLFAANLVVTRRHLEMIYQGLFLESAVAALVAACQLVSRYRTVRALHPNQIYYYMAFEERVQGFMGHWMHFSGQQMLIFSALLTFLFWGSRRRRAWWLVLVVVVASIVFSLTRGVWLGTLAAGLYVVAAWKPRWLWALPVLLGAGWLLTPPLVRERVKMALHPTADPALSIRLEMWQVGLRMIRTHPWLGVGPNNIMREYPLYLPPGKSPVIGYHGHLHNNFLQLGGERGLPALAVWAWFMIALVWQSWKMRRQVSQSRWVVEAALAGWLAFVVEGCFEFNFGSSPVLMLFLFLVSTPTVVEHLEGGGTVPDTAAIHRVARSHDVPGAGTVP